MSEQKGAGMTLCILIIFSEYSYIYFPSECLKYCSYFGPPFQSALHLPNPHPRFVVMVPPSSLGFTLLIFDSTNNK